MLIAVIGFGVNATAFADGEQKPLYGGIVTVVKDVQYELVAKPDSMTVYVIDHGKKVSTKGATGKLTILSGADKTEVALAPVAENGLAASGSFKIQSGAKAVATITLAGKAATSARFELK